MINTCQSNSCCRSSVRVWQTCGWLLSGGHATGDPVIPRHMPQRDQRKLVQSFPSISFLSSSPFPRSCRLSSLALGDIWFDWHRGFTKIKLNQDRRSVGWTQGNFLPAIYMKQRVQETPPYSQPSMATSSLRYSALWDLWGRSETFSRGLSLAPRRLPFLLMEWWCWGQGRLFLLLFTVPPFSRAALCPVLPFPVPPPCLLTTPPTPHEQDPNSGLSLEIMMQLHWQKTGAFDGISSREGDLAGSQVLSLGGFHSLVKITVSICAENADFATSSCIPVGITGLC